jgi:hypothetical protein
MTHRRENGSNVVVIQTTKKMKDKKIVSIARNKNCNVEPANISPLLSSKGVKSVINCIFVSEQRNHRITHWSTEKLNMTEGLTTMISSNYGRWKQQLIVFLRCCGSHFPVQTYRKKEN